MTSILKADTIQDTDGNNIINENSNTITIGASGDTISIPSGATIANSGTATGFGETNTPYFQAYRGSSEQTLGSASWTKIQINTEVVDSANAFDNSTNYRFTPTTSGKYFVYALTAMDTSAGNMRNAQTFIYKNGSELVRSFVNFHSSSGDDGEGASPTISTIIDMNGSSDYLELYVNGDTVSGSTFNVQGNASIKQTIFGAYKIIT